MNSGAVDLFLNLIWRSGLRRWLPCGQPADCHVAAPPRLGLQYSSTRPPPFYDFKYPIAATCRSVVLWASESRGAFPRHRGTGILANSEDLTREISERFAHRRGPGKIGDMCQSLPRASIPGKIRSHGEFGAGVCRFVTIPADTRSDAAASQIMLAPGHAIFPKGQPAVVSNRSGTQS